MTIILVRRSLTDVAMQGEHVDIERRIRAIQQESEATKDLPLPDDAVGERRGKSVVKSVRLPATEYEEIEQLAYQLEVPVGALIRGWVLQGLAEERGLSLRGAIERLLGEAERLRRIAHHDDVA